MHKPGLLLTGASGFLGHHIIEAAKNRFQIYGWYQHRRRPFLDIRLEQVNIGSSASLGTAFGRQRPAAVIHAAAISSIAEAERDTGRSWQINVTAAAQLARLAAEAGIPFIFCSTDMVFDGKKGNYTETDPAHPLNLYGEQKAAAEQAVLAEYKMALVLRLPLLVGYVAGLTPGSIAGMVEEHRRSGAVQLFTNEYRSVAWAADVADFILMAIDKKIAGLLHLGGPAPLSRFELGMLVRQYLKLNQLTITATTHAAANVKNRAENLSLNSNKAISIGYKPHTVADALQLLGGAITL